jgi:hypothetical protein
VNVLNVSLQQSIQVLHTRGWSRHRIARELGIHRKTVAAYLDGPKLPISTPGSADPDEAKVAISTAGSAGTADSKAAISTTGLIAGRVSLCREYLPAIKAAVTTGLSATRIHQDLVSDHGFSGSYESVKRCVRKLAQELELPVRRLECAPGEEMQVDFGQGAWIEAEGKRRRPHLFRSVLSHSRKGYSEVVWRQDTETFIRCCENAFRHFGGVTRTRPSSMPSAPCFGLLWPSRFFRRRLGCNAGYMGRFYLNPLISNEGVSIFRGTIEHPAFISGMNASHASFRRPAQAGPSAIRRFSKARSLSAQLGICPRTIFRWADQGMITRHKINARVVLFDEAEVIAFVESARVG